ncbi:MAG: AAA family ATPase [Ramlibacter sp.]
MEDATADLVHRLAARLGAELVETHISWVLLADAAAYKLKKPVRLPFVDYSTPERRQQFCEEEVRLNRRLAPSLYLGVVRVTGPASGPEIDGPGPTLDHAVRMRRFPAGALFSEQLAGGTLTGDSVDRFAAMLADFHAQAPPAPPAPERLPAARLRLHLAALDGARGALGPDDQYFLGGWIRSRCDALAPLWERRAAQGWVRDGHGDLHLANVVSLGEEVAAFDCIEFDAALRRIDVIEDAAFALMDFCARGRPDLGWRFFSAWLEQAGAHDALPALALSVVQRALVRAQAELLRSPGGGALPYARTALAWARRPRAGLTITHGLPGSDKSFEAQRLLQRQGAIRLRSDVERKRLYGLGALDDSAARGLDLYTPEATRRTYERLFTLARTALQGGIPVILDAAFLRRAERQQALALAREMDAPFAILACEAPEAVLRQRLLARRGDASEAGLAVLEALRRTAEPLHPDEQAHVLAAA